MKKQKFQSLLGMAKTFQCVDSNRADFWQGYQRGIRRLYHGENFGGVEEHEQFLNCRDGEYRRDLQSGYRAGFYYDQLCLDEQDDIQPLRKLLGWTVKDLAEIAAVSARTVEGWEQGRSMSYSALQLIRKFLMI